MTVRAGVIALVAVVLLLAIPASADDAGYTFVPHGDVAGGTELVLPLGGISNLRNLQCGMVTGNPGDLNCDIAAGDATHRGYVVVDWDLGAGLLVYDGSGTRAGLVASFLPGRIDFYRPVVFHAGASGIPTRVVVRVVRYRTVRCRRGPCAHVARRRKSF